MSFSITTASKLTQTLWLTFLNFSTTFAPASFSITFLGECKCNENYRGIDCAVLKCPSDCSQNGQCMNGTCICDMGYSGDDCGSVNICSNDCSGHGKCENR